MNTVLGIKEFSVQKDCQKQLKTNDLIESAIVMKKRICMLSIVITILIITALLNGCGSVSSGDLIGIWSGSWEYEGKQINSSIQFERDGSYVQITYTDGNLSSTEDGTYTIEGKKVLLIDNQYGSTSPYNYSNGKLKQNNHTFAKESK